MDKTKEMGHTLAETDDITVKLAESDTEVKAAQRLRYQVFYEEYKATPAPETKKEGRDIDPFDEHADHLIVIDRRIDDPQKNVIGTYRLLPQHKADQAGKFYTSDEYDIDALVNTDMKLLELGRSCVQAEYRTRPVLQRLWEGITAYMLDHDIDVMFGCASFHGTDVSAIAEDLSYMHHFHRAEEQWCPKALDSRYVNMNLIEKDDIDPKKVFSNLPPLMKGYLRVGALIGDGAVIDEQFNTIDVCIIMPIAKLTERYRKHYSRKVNRLIPSENQDKSADKTGKYQDVIS